MHTVDVVVLLFLAVAAAAGVLAVRSVRVVPLGHVGLLERSGRLRRQVDPGLRWRRPFGERLRLVDLRPQGLELRDEPVIAADDVVVLVDVTLGVQVHDAELATYAVADHRRAMERVAVERLREAGAVRPSAELLAGEGRLSEAVLVSCRSAGDAWGVRVLSVEAGVRPWGTRVAAVADRPD